MNLRLSEILKINSLNAFFTGDQQLLNSIISDVSIDSRTTKPNELFFAIKGDKFDGHHFINEVLNNQALAVVVEQKWYHSCNLPGNYLVVKDTLTAFQETSRYYRAKFNSPVIAITGSNGKTTTKEMVANVLSQKYHVLKNKGNLNNHVGVPLTLFKIDDSYNIALIEMGANHFYEIKRLAEIACPNYGLITNIALSHLEFFGSLEGVAKAKFELWDYLQANNGVAFVNVDDPLLAKMIPATTKVITYGFEQKADVKGEYLGSDELGNPQFKAMGTEIKLQVAGMHNIYNALSAVSVGLEFNLTIDQIKVALENFLPTSKRMEIIRKRGIIIINDCYNSNPLSAEKALNTLAQMKIKGRRFAVLADMLELGKSSAQLHKQIGELVAKLKIDYLLTFGSFSKYTVEQAKKLGIQRAIHFDDKKELTAFLNESLRQNDAVLIKGSRGMAMEEVTAGLCNNILR